MMNPLKAYPHIFNGTLPNDTVIQGGLYFSGTTRNKKHVIFPDKLTVMENLDLSQLTDLTTLPNTLIVKGWLDLRDCTGLTSLPNNLVVGEWLDLANCHNITSFPYNIHVGNIIYIGGFYFTSSDLKGNSELLEHILLLNQIRTTQSETHFSTKWEVYRELIDVLKGIL